MAESSGVRFFIPVKTPNPLNGSFGLTRGAAMAIAGRRREHRRLGYEQALRSLRLVGSATRTVWVPPKMRKGVVAFAGFHREVCAPIAGWWVVELVRVGRGLLDDDNLRAALKSLRDGIADALGVNDGARHQVRWSYSQHRESKRTGVEVTISRGLTDRVPDPHPQQEASPR